jgi:hypothetical protein
MKNFFHYQRSVLLFYAVTVACHAVSVSLFYNNWFFPYFISGLSLAGVTVMLFWLVDSIWSWKREREGEMLKKTYEL